MAIQLKIEPREAHDAFAAYAENASELQVAASRIGHSNQSMSHREMGAALAKLHQQGLELLDRALARGQHALSMRRALQAPDVTELLTGFDAQVAQLMSEEASSRIDRRQLEDAIKAVGREAQQRLTAIIDVVHEIVAAVEMHPALGSSTNDPIAAPSNSIERNARQTLLALASFEKVSNDPERGHHALGGPKLEEVAGLKGGQLEDAVAVLEERNLLQHRKKTTADPVGYIKLNARARLEAERLRVVGDERSTSPSSPAPESEPKLPRMAVRIGEKIDSGGFGTVWHATDLLERKIAVKFLTGTDEYLDEDALLREARSLAKVTHPNLVVVHGAAWLRHPVTGLVQPAIMMELLVGEVLLKWRDRQRERDAVLRVALGILRGVQAMHDAGLCHNDLHPKNVIVLATGEPKLIDWRYQDTFLEKPTEHRLDLIEAEQRRTIDLIVTLLEKQGLLKESLRIRGQQQIGEVLGILNELQLAKPLADLSVVHASAVDAVLDVLTKKGGGGYSLVRLAAEVGVKPSDARPLIEQLLQAGRVELLTLNDDDVVYRIPEQRRAAAAPDVVVAGFAPGTVAECARSIIAKIVSMEPKPSGYAAMLPLEVFATESGFSNQVVKDAAALLAEQGFVELHRNSKFAQLTRHGREEAHRLGEPIPSPKEDAQTLLRFLAMHHDGASELDNKVLCPKLGFHYRQLLDAGAELEAAGTAEISVRMTGDGNRALVKLTARGRATSRESPRG